MHFAAIEADLDRDYIERQLEALLESADAVWNHEDVLVTLDSAARVHMDEATLNED